VGDELFTKWAGSLDLWWRRAALVSTVAFNVRSLGGKGDTPRTLAICRLLVDDGEDMVVTSLSWALRMLVNFDPQAVEGFLKEHDQVLAGRVKREVGISPDRLKNRDGRGARIDPPTRYCPWRLPSLISITVRPAKSAGFPEDQRGQLSQCQWRRLAILWA
jgi:hypothetical protein